MFFTPYLDGVACLPYVYLATFTREAVYLCSPERLLLVNVISKLQYEYYFVVLSASDLMEKKLKIFCVYFQKCV
jgi:hypothetical protein